MVLGEGAIDRTCITQGLDSVNSMDLNVVATAWHQTSQMPRGSTSAGAMPQYTMQMIGFDIQMSVACHCRLSRLRELDS